MLFANHKINRLLTFRATGTLSKKNWNCAPVPPRAPFPKIPPSSFRLCLRGRLSRRFPPSSFRLCLRERHSRRFPPSSFRLCLRGRLSRRFPPSSSRLCLRGRLSLRFPPPSSRPFLRGPLSRGFQACLCTRECRRRYSGSSAESPR